MPSLDNVFWQSLAGPHRHLSAGTDTARRYAPGFSPIIAFADPLAPDVAALAPFCETGERFFCADWQGPAPAGWQVAFDGMMIRMAWAGGDPGDGTLPGSRQLGPQDADAAFELAALTKPGPFGPRTIEMGDYFGLFKRDRLIAMAGERTCATGAREVSGVCTHPDYQGRGLARRLVNQVIRRELARGELPFLHVLASNAAARGLYARMGFREDAQVPIRVIVRL